MFSVMRLAIVLLSVSAANALLPQLSTRAPTSVSPRVTAARLVAAEPPPLRQEPKAAVAVAPRNPDGLLQSRRPLSRKQLKEPAFQWLNKELQWVAQDFLLMVEERRQSAVWAPHQLGSCASSGRAWRLWAAWHSHEEVGPLGAQPLPRVLERAASAAADLTASAAADLTAFGPAGRGGEHGLPHGAGGARPAAGTLHPPPHSA